VGDTSTSFGRRGFSRVDAKRSFTWLAILCVAAVGYWFMLPALQSLVIPSAAGGRTGPWVLRPIVAFRFGAMAMMSCVTVAVIMPRLRRVWDREDAVLGTRYDPFSRQPLKRALVVLQSLLLALLYAAALIFYLFSWDVVGPDGIEEHLPWARLTHSFQDIVSLEMIPEGQRSDSISRNGPWYSIKLRSGRSITLSDDNEGITPEELTAMASFVANHSGLVWARRGDARAR